MTPAGRLRAKRWNEHVKLIVSFVNAVSIGALGLSLTVPIVAILSGEAAAPAEARDLGIVWEVAAGAVAFHILGHMLLRLLEAED